MFTRSIAGLALAALIAVPTIAGAQMSTPKPMKSPKAMSAKKMMKKSQPLTTSSSTHSMKAGQAQSTNPGAPTYSGSSGTGK